MAESISDKLQSRQKTGTTIITLALLGLMAGTGIYFWGLIVPFLIDCVSNTLKLAGLVAALGALAFVTLDPHMRTLWLYAYKSATRWLTAQFIDIDPIGILNTYVSRLKERLEQMQEAIGSLQGQRDQLAEYIQKNEAERIHELQRAAQAKKLVEKGGVNAIEMRGQMALSGRQAGRLEVSNKTLTVSLTRMDNMLRQLKKMKDTSDILAQDIEAEVKLRTEEYKMIQKSFGAFKLAQKVMASGGAEREMYDETLNRLADNYFEKMGQIDVFMEASKSMINGADLDNMAYEESALAQLEKWEKEAAATDASASTGPQTRVDASTGVRIAEMEEASPDSFSSLIEKKQGKG